MNGSLLSLDNNVLITPASFQFTSSSFLQEEFVLKVLNPNLEERNYLLALRTLGNSSNEYVATSQMILISRTAPVPQILFAIVGDGGSDMYIGFDTSTNSAGFSFGEKFLCAHVFNFSMASKTPCYWINSTVVRAVFPRVSESTLLPQISEKVFLLPKRIKASCSTRYQLLCAETNFSSPAFVELSAPCHPVRPTVILNIPRIVSSCDNFTIDTTPSFGIGGRKSLSFNWNIARIKGNHRNYSAYSLNIQQLLNELKDPSTVNIVPAVRFGFGTYSISLTITNWLGLSGTSTSLLTISSNSAAPQVKLLGAFPLSTIPSQALTIYSQASVPSCLSAEASLVYTWGLFLENRSVPVLSSSSNPTVFSLKPYSLVVGTYLIQLNVTSLYGNATLGTSTVFQLIKVNSGSIHAVIKGGSRRQVSTSGVLVLDGSASFDENEDSVSIPNLTFAWACIVSSFSDYGNNCSNIYDLEEEVDMVGKYRTVSIIGERLRSDLTYLISLTVRSMDGRKAMTSVDVQQSPPFAGSAAIHASTNRINLDHNFTLQGAISANYSTAITWEALIDGRNYSFNSYSPISVALQQSYVENTFLYSLVVGAFSFSSSCVVTFRLIVDVLIPINSIAGRKLLDDGFQRVRSTTEVNVKMNGNPIGGMVTVDPDSGLGLETDFSMFTVGWEDDPSDYPLSYSFGFRIQPFSPRLTISQPSPATVAFSKLPAGIQSYKHQIIVVSTATDIYAASSSTNVSVLVKNDPNVDVSNYLRTSLQLAFSSADSNAVFNAVNNVASTINW